jgi:ParB-like chromosome segregation protein Spo0J
LYVIDGHRRLQLAQRVGASKVYVQYLDEPSDADAFAKGVLLNLAQWAFERGDKLLWATASRRAAVERALHSRWLDPDGKAAAELYEYYPDLGRRYSSFPENHKEAATI